MVTSSPEKKCPMVQLYCSEQIAIPETFPNILKTFAKAAIRTQPYDILRWSAAYFRCLANDAPPPAKIRLERDCRQGSLTKGYLKVLIAQVGKGFFISRCLLQERWKALCLPEDDLLKYLSLCRMLNWPQVHWLKVVAVMIGSLNETPQATMSMVCELLTDDVDGGPARMPYWMFKICYTFVAKLECSQEQCFVNGQMVLPWGDLEEPQPMDRLPRILSATLLKDTIITSCQAKFDAPNYSKTYSPPESDSGSASTQFMINAQLGDPKELLTKCEDFDTILLLLQDDSAKPSNEVKFKGPHYISEKQLKNASKIEQTFHGQRQEQIDRCEQNAAEYLEKEAFQMLKEVGPPWTWLHRFTTNDCNTASYNFIDQESIVSDATPDDASAESFDFIKAEPNVERELSSASSCYLSEVEIEEKKASLESVKNFIEEATKENRCDLDQTSSVISLLKSEEMLVLQRAGEPYKPSLNLKEIIEVLERANKYGLRFTDVNQLIDHLETSLLGDVRDFPPLTTQTDEDKSELLSPQTAQIDEISLPQSDKPSMSILPEFTETAPVEVVIPPTTEEVQSLKAATEEVSVAPKDEITNIFENTVGIPAEQAAKMPKFCFETKDEDEMILGLIPLNEHDDEVQEEEEGSIFSESGEVSGEGYKQDESEDKEQFVDKTTPRTRNKFDYCCVDAPTLTPKPYVPPPQQFHCSLNPYPGIGAAVSQKTIDEFLAFLQMRSRSQKGLINPRNFREEKCPYMVDTTQN